MRRKLLSFATAVTLSVSALLGAASPAQAAESPSALCGSGYYVIDSHGLPGATVYLLYKSNGYNCVVTIKTADRGKATMVGAYLILSNDLGAFDEDPYKYYAGPVRAAAAGKCIQFGGSSRGTVWTSPWGHCG
ncbi:hypothetical protein ACN263_24285 [Micromonospora sp. WMMD729]|uniref:hypothetical protein n=1 Tax=Micromonospora sp. WMMD729 TaxID=3404127 RepID=UPI003BF5E3F3